MWRVVLLSVIQSTLLAGGQVFLKFALQKMLPFGWTRQFWGSLLLNWQFACSGLFFGSSSILWMYIVKHYPLSVAYPMIQLKAMCFGLLAAILFFHESVSVLKWCGVILIIVGCCMIAKIKNRRNMKKIIISMLRFVCCDIDCFSAGRQ